MQYQYVAVTGSVCCPKLLQTSNTTLQQHAVHRQRYTEKYHESRGLFATWCKPILLFLAHQHKAADAKIETKQNALLQNYYYDFVFLKVINKQMHAQFCTFTGIVTAKIIEIG